MTRRRIGLIAGAALLALVAVACTSDDKSANDSNATTSNNAAPTASAEATTTTLPAAPVKVSGPVPNGKRPNAFGAAVIDVGAYGYVEEEYFLEGEATAYEPVAGTELGADGHWQLKPSRTAPFKTRILVERPKDPAKFSGNVIVSWMNVTAGFEINGVTPVSFRNGDVQVALSAQKVGLDGLPGQEANGLKGWDPERYGTLNHPGDDFSFDILTKAAQVVGPKRAAVSPDPLAGLKVERIFATGGSQSAIRLNSYMNGVQPLTHAFNGFLPIVSFGRAAAFDTRATGGDLAKSMLPNVVKIRDDLDVPVLLVTTESETQSLYPVRQPDTAKYRTWEIAGAAHAGGAGANADIARVFVRDGLQIPKGLGADTGGAAGVQPNQVSYIPVVNAAWRHLIKWATDGTLPPSLPLIDYEGNPPTIKRDSTGNATGGIRVPELEAPIAEYRGSAGGSDELASLSGSTKPYSAEKLKQLYPTREDYIKKWSDAVDRGVAAGYLLEIDAASIKQIAVAQAAKLFP
jgi:hypothetical protein